MVNQYVAAIATLLMIGLTAPTTVYAKKDPFAEMTAEELFNQTCSSCHNTDIPKHQRLDKKNWQWVIEDMKKFGLRGVPDEYLDKIADYLAENYGPTKKLGGPN